MNKSVVKIIAISLVSAALFEFIIKPKLKKVMNDA